MAQSMSKNLLRIVNEINGEGGARMEPTVVSVISGVTHCTKNIMLGKLQ